MPEKKKLFLWNNQNLFSNNYLEHRLPSTDLWVGQRESAEKVFASIKKKYKSIEGLHLGPGQEAELEDKFIRPVLKALGYEYNVQPITQRGYKKKRPDYALFKDPDSLRAASKDKDNPKKFFSQALTILESKYWGRRLNDTDKSDILDSRDPTAQTVKYLDDVNFHTDGKINWAILTNGRHWRLFYYRAASRSGNYFEVDLEEIITRGVIENFLYFYLFFSRDAFVPDPTIGKTWLDQHLKGTEEYAVRVSTKLKDLIFDKVFEGLAEGFVHYRRYELSIDKETDESRRNIFKGCLTFLYRLLFLLYAESRNLLPINEDAYYKVSLLKLKKDIFKDLSSAVFDKMSKRYYSYWSRLESLFDIIAKGDPALNVPIYNGGLFETPKDSFLSTHKMPDPFLAEAIELLTVDHEGEYRPDTIPFIDYSSLNVRHLGDIYEGLLEFRVQIAGEDIVVIKKEGKSLWLKAAEVKEGAKISGKKTKGEVYIENSRHERKATGSYYTPHYIVEYIVKNTVEPVLDERLKTVEALLKQIEDTNKALRKQKSTSGIQGYRAKVKELEDSIFNTIFVIKVLDPAMGSGHFLVHTVDFISDRIISFLADYPENPVIRKIAQLKKEILKEIERQGVRIDESKLTEVNLIKRMVMKRCIYGVDLNDMAVELAKLSLWLDSFTLGAPLSFLDHHLKCGNSLIGTNIKEIEKALAGHLFAINLEPLKRAIRDMIFVSDLPDATLAQVRESCEKFGEANRGLEGYRILLDMLVAEHFGIPEAKKTLVSDFDRIDLNRLWESIKLLPENEQKLIEQVKRISDGKRFFHWEVEFPEVFYEQKVEFMQKVHKKENPGFDCVIGNPPYINVEEISSDDRNFLMNTGFYTTTIKRMDIFIPFHEISIKLLRKNGRHSFIVPFPLLTQDYGQQLRLFFLNNTTIVSIVDLSKHKIFPDATVRNIVPLFEKKILEDYPIQIISQEEDPSEIKEIRGSIKFIDVSQFRDTYENMFRIDLTPELHKIQKKIDKKAIKFGKIFAASWGARGVPVEKFHLDSPINKHCKKMVKGSNVDRYELSYSGKWLLYDTEKLYRPSMPDFFENLKIIFQEVTGKHGLIGVYDSTKFYTDHSLICCIPKYCFEKYDEKKLRKHKIYIHEDEIELSKNYSILFVLSVMNSNLNGFYFLRFVGYDLNVYPENIEYLPIPHISFTTPDKERKERVSEAIKLYQTEIEAIAINADKWQNKNREERDDKDRDKKSSAKSRKVAERPRRYKLPEEGISGEDPGLGGEVHGIREGAGEYKPPEGTSQEGEDSTRPLDSTRYFETAQGIKTYSEVSEILAVSVTKTIEAIIDQTPDDIHITPEWICKLHSDMAGALFSDWAGRFRDVNVTVGTHIPPPYYEVPVHTRLYCDDLTARLSFALKEKDIEKISETLAYADWRFQWIHPFKDFNGRIGRIILTAVLFKLKLPPAETASVEPEEKEKYLNALQAADKGDISMLAGIWIERLSNAFRETEGR